MKRHFLIVAAVIISSQLWAQQDTTLLDEAVITANRFEQKQSQTGKVVSVISKDQIEKSSGRTIAQVLNEQAGIFINGANQTAGSIQTVFLRGASSGRTLILLDGIPVSDPSMINNEFDLNLISINDVERIEICKGAQSTLYGSDAVAGAINIITVKKDVKNPFNIKATSAFGNKNTNRNNIQLYGKAGKLRYTTRFAKFSTDGFSSANDNTGSGTYDKDGYDGNSINAAIDYQLFPSLLVNTFVQHSQYKAAIDAGVFADEKDYTIRNNRFSTGLGLRFQKGIVNATANYQYSDQSRAYHNDSFFVRPFGTKFERNQYKGRTRFVELFGNITATSWLTILAGTDYRWATMNQDYFSISSFGPYSSRFDDSSMHQTSFYGSIIISALKKKLNVEAGARTNNHSRYGHNSTYTFNPSYAITNNWRIFGSIASGFKAPSIFQVYDVYSGNIDLKAEESTNYELGIQQSHKKINSRLVGFHRDIRNGIDYNYSTFKYFNFVKQAVTGLELELSVRPVPKLNLAANYTFITGEEKTESRKSFNDTVYNHLLRRPKHSLNLNLGYQFSDQFYAAVTMRAVSKRYDVGGYKQEDIIMDNYILFNAYAAYKLKKNIRFFADLQNLANKTFFDTRGYNAIPFLINGGISFEW